ncbi:hypothetical protein F442_19826 [Phytophthora nicotianae P10297]|uniref:Uncharacterized protein n=1 Tax=Phytophthora nicotianae P10297 TaxID=1317064 RepID=W2Y8I0_PHYNI|nr:hypothetical protein F442_19826 [Phytophthora nicotianae P10297]
MSPFEIDSGHMARSPIGTALSRNDYLQNFADDSKRIVA